MGSDWFPSAPSTCAGLLEAPGASMSYDLTRKTLKISVKVTVFGQK